MNGNRNTTAAALALSLSLALAVPAAASAQTALDRRDDALAGHPAEEQQDLLGSDDPLTADDPGGIANTDDTEPGLNPLRDVEHPLSTGLDEEDSPSILDEEGERGGGILRE